MTYSRLSDGLRAAAVAAALTAGTTAFAQVDPLKPPPIPDPLVTTSRIAWIAIERSTDPAVLESFLRKFPQSPEAELAQRRLESLARKPASR